MVYISTKMKSFIVLVVLAAIGKSQGFPDRKSHTDIIGGEPATYNQFPWHVLLLSDNGMHCGGTLVSEKWVLTAAHCTDKATSIKLSFGSNNINGTVDFMVTKVSIHQHKEYNSNLNNDVSLIELPKEITSTDVIKPIQLLSRKQALGDFNNQKGIIAGFGYTTIENPNISEFLIYTTVRVIKNAECRVYYGPEKVIDSTICTSGPKNTIHSICVGDSGGALIIEEDGSFTQIGVISFSDEHCGKLGPSAYARVGSFLKFIEDTTKIPIRD